MTTQNLTISFRGKTYPIEIPSDATVWQLKERIDELTEVFPIHQRLLGLLPKGAIPGDSEKLSDLKLKNPHKVILMGTPAREMTDLLETEREALIIKRKEEAKKREKEARLAEERRIEEERMEAMRKEREEQRRISEERQRKMWEEQRRVQLQNEIQNEMDTSAELTLVVQAYSSGVAGKPELEMNDKIIMSANMLEQIVGSRLPMPLTFQILPTIETDRQCHCGVLEFTAPPNTVYLPYWMMEKMSIMEGDQIILKNVNLPKGTFLKLQPHSADWMDIPYATRKPVLEFALRKFQVLTIGDAIAIEYGGKDYKFTVLHLDPAGAVSILDTDIAVEVMEPLEDAIIEDVIEIGQEVRGELAENSVKYYSFTIDDPNSSIMLRLHPTQGDADMYVSTKTKKPDVSNYMWMSQNLGSKEITINNTSSHFVTGLYHVTIVPYEAPASYIFSVKEAPIEGGNTLGSPEMAATVICSNCLRKVPESSLEMHQLMCLRRNKRCPLCDQVVSTEAYEKHQSLSHAQMQCQCGMTMDAIKLKKHKETECQERPIKCRFCPLHFPAKNIRNHERECGSRTAACSHCGSVFKRMELRKHLSQEHDIIMSDLTQSTELEHLK